MVQPVYTTRFKRSYRKLRRSGKLFREEAERVVSIISKGQRLPEKYRDHALAGDWIGYRECNVKPDLLLIYKIEKQMLILADIGSHSNLFG